MTDYSDKRTPLEKRLDEIEKSQNFEEIKLKRRKDNIEIRVKGERVPVITSDSHELSQELSQEKHKEIIRLKQYNYRTAPEKIAMSLERLFGPSRKSGHWFYVARCWNPRQINWVLSCLVKMKKNGVKIRNQADCFTWLIKKRKRRVSKYL